MTLMLDFRSYVRIAIEDGFFSSARTSISMVGLLYESINKVADV